MTAPRDEFIDIAKQAARELSYGSAEYVRSGDAVTKAYRLIERLASAMAEALGDDEPTA